MIHPYSYRVDLAGDERVLGRVGVEVEAAPAQRLLLSNPRAAAVERRADGDGGGGLVDAALDEHVAAPAGVADGARRVRPELPAGGGSPAFGAASASAVEGNDAVAASAITSSLADASGSNMAAMEGARRGVKAGRMDRAKLPVATRSASILAPVGRPARGEMKACRRFQQNILPK